MMARMAETASAAAFRTSTLEAQTASHGFRISAIEARAGSPQNRSTAGEVATTTHDAREADESPAVVASFSGSGWPIVGM